MTSILRQAAVAAGLLLLAACASTPEIPFERTAQIKTIGLLTPAEPSGASVVLASSMGQSFGLIGALVDVSMQANRDSQFENAMKANHFSFDDSFKEDLEAHLKTAGYEVVDLAADRKSHDYLGTYPATDGKVDAYLDVVVTSYGYIASGIGTDSPYRPFVVVRCRLLRASDSAVLMQDAVAYNPVSGQYPPKDKVITIPPDPKFAFANFDSLIAYPKNASDNLAAAADETAKSVGTLLK